MTLKAFDVAVIGGGLSGLVAANILKEHDLNILIVDEYDHLGGQFFRTHPKVDGADPIHRFLNENSFGTIQNIEDRRITVMTRSRVLDLNEKRELLLDQDFQRLWTLTPEIVLLATGARETFIPFKGWTLPGVISTGAVQILLKDSGVLAAESMIVAGSGLFLYTVASEVMTHGGRVSAVFNENASIDKLGFPKGFNGHGATLKEGIRQWAKILFSRTRMKHRYRIVEACGEKQLEAVRVAKVDAGGHVVSNSEKEYPCDGLAVGYGFTANMELGLSAGCSPLYDAGKGGWVLHTDETLETDVSGIFAAGEVIGIGGALKSIDDGKLAAYSILKKLGLIADPLYGDLVRAVEKRRKGHLRFGSYFNRLNRPSAEMIKSIPDDTILCRCEDITVGEVKAAIQSGCRSSAAVKRAVRTGMGSCQGRICGPVICEMISTFTNTPVTDQTPLPVRSPVKAVPLEVLAKPISQLMPE